MEWTALLNHTMAFAHVFLVTVLSILLLEVVQDLLFNGNFID